MLCPSCCYSTCQQEETRGESPVAEAFSGVYERLYVLGQVTEEPSEEETEDIANLWNSFNDEEEEEAMVFFVLQESTGYMAPMLRALAVIHTVISLVCVVGYYCLKVSCCQSKSNPASRFFLKDFSNRLRLADIGITRSWLKLQTVGPHHRPSKSKSTI